MRTKPRPRTQEEIAEWSESLVTEYVLSIFERKRDLLEKVGSTDVYHPFDPQRTQEVLASRNAAIDTWEEAISALKGESEFYEYSEDESYDE